MTRVGSWLIVTALALLPTARADGPGGPDPWIESHLPGLSDLYRDLHKNPELSNREFKTSQKIAKALQGVGAEVTTNVGALGVVGVIRNGQGPTVMVRAEMDALEVTETTGLPYASRTTTNDDQGVKVGVMHACGHDMHMAILVGTAGWLIAHKDKWEGTVLLIAQPSEEAADGARRMLADGLYQRFSKPDYALALHVSSDLEAGKVGYQSGPSMAGTTGVAITVRGRGGHGAMPNRTVDPIVLASTLVLDLQSIVSREINPIEPAVLTIGSIHGGASANVIPEEVRLRLTLRWFRPEVRDQLVNGIRRRAPALAQAHGAPPPRIDIGGGVPPLINTPSLVERVVPDLEEALGEDNVVEIDPSLIAEDFGIFGQSGVPTFMFRLGTVPIDRAAKARTSGEILPSLHSSAYYPDLLPSLRTGIRAMTSAVVGLLPAE